jgi:hypothetical protein
MVVRVDNFIMRRSLTLGVGTGVGGCNMHKVD